MSRGAAARVAAPQADGKRNHKIHSGRYRPISPSTAFPFYYGFRLSPAVPRSAHGASIRQNAIADARVSLYRLIRRRAIGMIARDRFYMEGGLQPRLLTMKRYRRHLPHCDAPGLPVFLTWRLRGSLPAERVFLPEHLTSGEAFLNWDRLLDQARSGPVHLRHPEIAALVREQLHEVAANSFCRLHAWVIMPNHVHLLCTPRIELGNFVRRVKGPTAREANKLLNRTGEAFWQEEFFDRIIRNDQEFERIRRYIEWNPVKAALANRPEDFAWSSAALLQSEAQAPRITPPMEGGLQPASSFSSTVYEPLSGAEPQFRSWAEGPRNLQSGAKAPRGLKPALL